MTFPYSMHCSQWVTIIHAKKTFRLTLFAYSLFRDVNAALIVFDVQERRTFEKAVSDHTQPDGTTRKSWFKEVNNRSGDIPPIKILGMLPKVIIIIVQLSSMGQKSCSSYKFIEVQMMSLA